MSRSVVVHLLLSCSVVAVLFTGCTRDPNARKQKYFDSGEKYFGEGKYREAVIQYCNALTVNCHAPSNCLRRIIVRISTWPICWSARGVLTAAHSPNI
jgi:hypothetical protein